MTDRKDVYASIDSERAYQETLWSLEDPNHTIGDFLVFIDQYVHKAKDAYLGKDNIEPTLHVLRKVAALAVGCMEQHGAPRREGY